jgi:hypothetical protein
MNYAVSFAHFLFCLVQVAILTDHCPDRPTGYQKLEFLLRGLEFVPAYLKLCQSQFDQYGQSKAIQLAPPVEQGRESNFNSRRGSRSRSRKESGSPIKSAKKGRSLSPLRKNVPITRSKIIALREVYEHIVPIDRPQMSQSHLEMVFRDFTNRLSTGAKKQF